jgi:endonuclease YncB( thermonuclease family)
MLLLALAGQASAAELFGKVVAIADGDTVTVLDESFQQHKIRLSGIDAPERRQSYGERAKQHLFALAYHKAVRVVWMKRDRYRRIVGRVFVGDCGRFGCRYAQDAGLEQIKAGLAWHYKQYVRDQSPAERAAYAAFELQARKHREGLWQEAAPVPPWEFRSASISSRHSPGGE